MGYESFTSAADDLGGLLQSSVDSVISGLNDSLSGRRAGRKDGASGPGGTRDPEANKNRQARLSAGTFTANKNPTF